MPEKSALCPYLAPKPSRALRGFLLGVHALSLLAAWLNPLPIWLRLSLALGVLLSLWQALARQSQPEVVGLRLKADGHWALHLRDGSETEASLLGSSLVNPGFVLLHLQAQGRRHALLICRDSLAPDAFRRLRVALKVAGMVEGEEPVSH